MSAAVYVVVFIPFDLQKSVPGSLLCIERPSIHLSFIRYENGRHK